jgi:hypothetical protein
MTRPRVKRNAHHTTKSGLTARVASMALRQRSSQIRVVKTTSRVSDKSGYDNSRRDDGERQVHGCTRDFRAGVAGAIPPRARTRPRFWLCLRNTHPSACTRLQDQTPRRTSPPHPLPPGPAAAGGGTPRSTAPKPRGVGPGLRHAEPPELRAGEPPANSRILARRHARSFGHG